MASFDQVSTNTETLVSGSLADISATPLAQVQFTFTNNGENSIAWNLYNYANADRSDATIDTLYDQGGLAPAETTHYHVPSSGGNNPYFDVTVISSSPDLPGELVGTVDVIPGNATATQTLAGVSRIIAPGHPVPIGKVMRVNPIHRMHVEP